MFRKPPVLGASLDNLKIPRWNSHGVFPHNGVLRSNYRSSQRRALGAAVPGSHGQHPSTKGSPRASNVLMPRGEMPNGQFSPRRRIWATNFFGVSPTLGSSGWSSDILWYIPVDNDHNDHAFDHNISWFWHKLWWCYDNSFWMVRTTLVRGWPSPPLKGGLKIDAQFLSLSWSKSASWCSCIAG